MIHLEKVTYQNALEICELSIFESQYPFVWCALISNF